VSVLPKIIKPLGQENGGEACLGRVDKPEDVASMPCSPIQELLEASMETLVSEIKEKARQIRSGLKEGLRDLER
jgi:hypothetical protein